jgi:hypothetical protein
LAQHKDSRITTERYLDRKFDIRDLYEEDDEFVIDQISEDEVEEEKEDEESEESQSSEESD